MGGFGAFLAHSQVANFIKDLDFPASKQDIINAAEDNNAPEQVIKALEKIPDQVYNSIGDVTAKLGK